MRLVLIALTGATLLLTGCGAIHTFRDDAVASKAGPKPVIKDCSKGGVGCPLNRRQYYDDHTARYYYFDQSTGRYYWENGEPRF